MSEHVVQVKNVAMRFNLSSEQILGLKEYVIKMLKGELFFQEFWALRDVSLEVKHGEMFGLIGFNGAGKSTLLKIIAGVLKPTAGLIRVNGSIAPLIELGAGFDVDLTARENIFLNGAILGYSRKAIHKNFDAIVDFAELSEFLDVPIKNFSSGMIARLGFSIATAIRPDVLIVDEILAVGDYRFQQKCIERIKHMLQHGTTILFVSHSIEQVKEFCHRAAWIENGAIRKIGDAREVCESFQANR